MKSYVRKTDVYNVAPDQVVLTVGMIVKNEEKHLENCLSALKKFLDNISGELIIVDTGSTDRTKEIALKYTDKVYDFEWCNDFSAARNYGLKKAKGKWFMQLDADEYLDDNCSELIKFFNIPELWQKYNSASIPILNYSYGRKNAFDQFLAPRFVKLVDDTIQFRDPIHEWLPQPNPHGMFSTKLHHYGYVFANKDESKKKGDRNITPLLKEYEENPDDLRIIAHLCDAIYGVEELNNFENHEKYFKLYYDAAQKELNTIYGIAAYPKIILFYKKNNCLNEAMKYVDEYLSKKEYENSVVSVSVYWFASQIYMSESEIKDYSKAYEYLLKYFEFYDKFINNELEMIAMRAIAIRGSTKSEYESQILRAADCTNKLKMYKKSLEYLGMVELEDMEFEFFKLYLNIVRDLTEKTNDYTYIAKIYESVQKLNDNDRTRLVLFLMQQYYLEHLSEREDFMNAMIKSGIKGKYIDLMKLVKDDMDDKDISSEIQQFIDSVDDWTDGYSVAIMLAMKHNADLTVPISRMNNKLIRDNLRVIYDGYYEFSKIASEYFDYDNFNDDIRKLYFMVTALEFACEGLVTLSYDEKGCLCDTFVCALSDYVMNIYNPDLLNPDDIDVLPELHRFGYYMTLAFAAQDEGNDLVYIRSLKEALRLCESMKDVVQYYLTEFEKNLN